MEGIYWMVIGLFIGYCTRMLSKSDYKRGHEHGFTLGRMQGIADCLPSNIKDAFHQIWLLSFDKSIDAICKKHIGEDYKPSHLKKEQDNG